MSKIERLPAINFKSEFRWEAEEAYAQLASIAAQRNSLTGAVRSSYEAIQESRALLAEPYDHGQ